MKPVPPLLVILAAACAAVHASEPGPDWSNRWSAHVWNTYCELRLDYLIPNPERRGLLAGRSIDRLFARFAASTRTHFGLIPEEKLFEVRFDLLFYGEAGNPIPDEDRILSLTVDEFDTSSQIAQRGWIHTFSLDQDATASLLQRLRENKTIEIVVQFADGQMLHSKIYPSGDKDFHVWEAMFRTCIRENVD